MSDAVHQSRPSSRAEAHHHEEKLGFIRKYVFSLDHKVIGIQYAVTALLFLFFGFCLMMLLRWQLAYPGKPLPIAWLAKLLGDTRMPGGMMVAGILPSAWRHARHDHGVSWSRSVGRGRLRQLRAAASNRRSRYGISQTEHDELLGVTSSVA